jgi:hypothetical protein
VGASSSLTFVFHFSFVEEFFNLEVMGLSSSHGFSYMEDNCSFSSSSDDKLI